MYFFNSLDKIPRTWKRPRWTETTNNICVLDKVNDKQVCRQGRFFFEGTKKALCYILWRLCQTVCFPPASLQGWGWLDFNTMAFISPLHSGNWSQGAISSGKPTLAPGRESPGWIDWDGIQRAGLFQVCSMPLQAGTEGMLRDLA